MLEWKCPMHSHCNELELKIKYTVNLKSASFIILMPLQEGLTLTYIHKKKPRLHFGKSFTLIQATRISSYPKLRVGLYFKQNVIIS